MSETKQVALRLDRDFHDRISLYAEKEERSLHAQVVYILRAWFNADLLRKRIDDLDSRNTN